MVSDQFCPADLMERAEDILPVAPFVGAVKSQAEGYVRAMDTKAIGNAVVSLGGGRLHPDDGIDPAVGLSPVSYTHLTLPTIVRECRSRWSPYH